MLELAVRSGIPLIVCRTTDLLNFNRLLAATTKRAVREISHNELPEAHRTTLKRQKELLWTSARVPSRTCRDICDALKDLECQLVVVNPEEALSAAFDVGEVGPDARVMLGFLRDNMIPDPKAKELLPGLSGLTLKEALELIRLTEARSRALKLETLLDTRRIVFSSIRGIQVVDTSTRYYWPNQTITDYLKWAQHYLLADCDDRLRPRGVLLYGPAGTGKSIAAKQIARECCLPLLRLDIGAVKDKYHGESERVMADALKQVEREAPCVLLVDEVEKLFNSQHDEGTTQNLLAEVLWWLAEHRVKVLTVMTTNDVTAIPSELIRSERIDQHIELYGLDIEEAELFCLNLMETFLPVSDEICDMISETLQEAFVDEDRLTPAVLTSMMKSMVRKIGMSQDAG